MSFAAYAESEKKSSKSGLSILEAEGNALLERCVKSKTARAQQPILSKSSSEAAALQLVSLAWQQTEEDLGQFLTTEKVPEKIKAMFASTLFYIEKGNSSCGQEKYMLPTMRYQFSGSRSVVVAESDSLIRYMDSLGLELSTPAVLYQFLHNAHGAGVTSLIEAVPSVQYGTVGPGEALILPYGYVFAESTADAIVGVRIPFLSKSAVFMQRTIQNMQQQKKKMGMTVENQEVSHADNQYWVILKPEVLGIQDTKPIRMTT